MEGSGGGGVVLNVAALAAACSVLLGTISLLYRQHLASVRELLGAKNDQIADLRTRVSLLEARADREHTAKLDELHDQVMARLTCQDDVLADIQSRMLERGSR